MAIDFKSIRDKRIVDADAIDVNRDDRRKVTGQRDGVKYNYTRAEKRARLQSQKDELKRERRRVYGIKFAIGKETFTAVPDETEMVDLTPQKVGALRSKFASAGITATVEQIAEA